MRIDLDDNLASSPHMATTPGPSVAMQTRQTPAASDLSKLTDAQRDCLRLVHLHMTSKEIARALNVSPHTVDMRLRIAIKTLDVGSRVEAAHLLAQHEAGSNVTHVAHQLRPWRKINKLGLANRFVWIITIAFMFALAFGAIVSALNALRTLFPMPVLGIDN